MEYTLTNPKKQEELILLESLKGELAPAIFTERQLSVIKKKLRNETLTQTEKNYLSNSIKKKFQALNILFNSLNFNELISGIYNQKISNQKIITNFDSIIPNEKRNIEEDPELRRILKKLLSAKRIAIITGAGISISSGLLPYRGENGLWNQIEPLESLSEKGFSRNPNTAIRILNEFKQKITQSKPNTAHYTLARMEHLFESFTIITQNIDGYHQMSGSSRIFELHGNILSSRKKNGLKIPNIKLFDEEIDHKNYKYSLNSIMDCDILLIIGTSGYFDYIKDLVKNCPGYIIEINPEKTELSNLCDTLIKEKAEIILPRIYSSLLKNRLIKEFRTNFKSNQIKSIYLYGSILNERRLPKDIDILIIPQMNKIDNEIIVQIKNKIRKISGIKNVDIQLVQLEDIKKKFDNYKRNVLFKGILLYGKNMMGELYGNM